jgi:queuine tRNA-ribosyltransferase
MLNTHHNIAFYLNLMSGMREAIRQDRLGEFRNSFYAAQKQ